MPNQPLRTRGLPGALASVVLAVGLLAPRVAASAVSVRLSATDACGSSASARGTLVAYYDGLLLQSADVSALPGAGCYSDVNYGAASLFINGTGVTLAAVNSEYVPDPLTGDLFRPGTGLKGNLALTAYDNYDAGGSTTYGPYVSQPQAPGLLTLGSHGGIAHDQVDVTVSSYVCDWSSTTGACADATWTIAQQRLSASGGVLATRTYTLSVPPAGSATWTSGDQQAGYAYRYAASVVGGGTTYRTNAAVFPVAGTPTVGSITSTRAAVSWPAVDGASPYTFGWWSTSGGSWPGTTSSVGGTSEPLAGLSPNMRYAVGIAASTPDGGPAWAQGSAAFWTLANPPSSITAAGVGQTGFTLSWSANGNPSGTTYRWSVVPAGQGPVGGNQDTTTSTSTSVATASNGAAIRCDTSYSIAMQAMNNAGVWSGWVAGGTLLTLPCTPASLSRSSPTPSGFSIAWSANGNGSNASYAVAYETNGTWHDLPGTTSATGYAFTGLACDTTIQNFAVRANNATGASPWAYDGGASFRLDPCDAASVSVSVSASGVLSVSWSANGNAPATRYNVKLLDASSAVVRGPASTTGTSIAFAGVCGGSFHAEVQAEDASGPSGWVGSSTVGAPACLALSIGAPTGYPPSHPYQLDVTVASWMASAGTATITQQQLSPSGAVVAAHTFSVSVAAGSSGTYAVANQQYGGPGYVYRYTATMDGQTSNAALFANAPTFYVHRRTRGLFVTFPDEGNGAQYEVFGGPGSGGCDGGGDFNSGLLPAGTTQWAVGGLTPNSEYSICMSAEIPGQPATSGNGPPTWWAPAGDANASGMWYTLPDVPGEATAGGLLAAYYDVPSLASHAGPSAQVFGHHTDYTAIQGPIDFSLSCNCTSSWPYANDGGPMPAHTAGSGTARFFAAKYLGWVYAPSSGTYTFGCAADDACQVWVDGQPVVDGMTGSGSSPNYYGACNACGGASGTIALTAGNWYPLEIDYTQQGGGAQIHFTWTLPGGGSEEVPASDLAYPSLTGTPASARWQATISWATDGNPSGTTYSVSQDLFSPSGAVQASSAVCSLVTADSCTTTNLTAGTVSRYDAFAVSGDGYATPAATEPGGGGFAWAVPPPPSGVQAPSSSSLTVRWPSLGNGAHYEVGWAVAGAGGPSGSSGDLGTGATSYTMTGLSPDTKYQSWLTAWIPEPSGVGDGACGGGGCARYRNGDLWTLADPPSSLVLTGASNSLSMSWSPDGNPPGTAYDWSVTAEGGSSAAHSGQVTGTGATATGLVCQSNYTAAVEAVNGAGVATVGATAAGETGTCSPPPKVALEVDNGLAQTAVAVVTLDVQATDANYAQSQLQMRFSNDGNAWSAWRPYTATASWTLAGAPGPNTVYAEVRDPQDGLGSAIATIAFDSSLPTITPGGGPACTYGGTTGTCTRSPIVTATFTVPAGSVSMETSLDGVDWSQPQDAQAGVSLVLPAGDGLKAVFARYFNRDNVATPEGPDYFVLDTTAPVIRSVAWLNGAAVTDGGSATLVVQASDNITPASVLRVTVSGAASWSGTRPPDGQIPLTVTGAGYVTVDVEVADQAGNSATAQVGIYNS